jgi:hypothetical protein
MAASRTLRSTRRYLWLRARLTAVHQRILMAASRTPCGPPEDTYGGEQDSYRNFTLLFQFVAIRPHLMGFTNYTMNMLLVLCEVHVVLWKFAFSCRLKYIFG